MDPTIIQKINFRISHYKMITAQMNFTFICAVFLCFVSTKNTIFAS